MRYLSAQLQTSLLKCDGLENRSRRDNICIRNLEEGAEGPDLEALVVGLFSEVLGDLIKVKLDSVLRVGPQPTCSSSSPRDIGETAFLQFSGCSAGGEGKTLTVAHPVSFSIPEALAPVYPYGVWALCSRNLEALCRRFIV